MLVLRLLMMHGVRRSVVRVRQFTRANGLIHGLEAAGLLEPARDAVFGDQYSRPRPGAATSGWTMRADLARGGIAPDRSESNGRSGGSGTYWLGSDHERGWRDALRSGGIGIACQARGARCRWPDAARRAAASPGRSWSERPPSSGWRLPSVRRLASRMRSSLPLVEARPTYSTRTRAVPWRWKPRADAAALGHVDDPVAMERPAVIDANDHRVTVLHLVTRA